MKAPGITFTMTTNGNLLYFLSANNLVHNFRGHGKRSGNQLMTMEPDVIYWWQIAAIVLAEIVCATLAVWYHLYKNKKA